MIHPVGTRTIVTERCVLRRICAEDAAAMYESWAKYEEGCRYFPFDPASDAQSYRERVLRCGGKLRFRALFSVGY